MSTIASRSVAHSLTTALQTTGARLWRRTRFALRRFAALYAEARIRQAAIEIRRFEACHRPLFEREGGLRPRLADDVHHSSR